LHLSPQFKLKFILYIHSYSSPCTDVLWTHNVTRGPFLKDPGTFSYPETYSKISNLLITVLFYSHILNINGSSLYTGSCVHISPFLYADELKTALRAREFEKLYLNCKCSHALCVCYSELIPRNVSSLQWSFLIPLQHPLRLFQRHRWRHTRQW